MDKIFSEEKVNDDNNGEWKEYKKYLLSTIDNLVDDNENIKKEISSCQMEMINKLYQSEEKMMRRVEEVSKDIAVLKIRATMLGATVGFFSSGVLILIMKLIEKFVIKL